MNVKVIYKGVFTLDEQLLIVNKLKRQFEGTYLVSRSETTHIPKIEKVA